MFIREKLVKGKPYAYAVESVWTTQGARQKNIAYLGRVFVLPLSNTSLACIERETESFVRSFHLDEKGRSSSSNAYSKRVIINLIGVVLSCAGFMDEGSLTFSLSSKKMGFNCVVDIPRCLVRVNRRDAVLKIGEGYLSGFSLRELVKASSSKGTLKERAKLLAGALVNCGISLKPPIFVELFKRIWVDDEGVKKFHTEEESEEEIYW